MKVKYALCLAFALDTLKGALPALRALSYNREELIELIELISENCF